MATERPKWANAVEAAIAAALDAEGVTDGE